MGSQNRQTITPDEAARQIGCSRSHITKLYQQRQIEGYAVGLGKRSRKLVYLDSVLHFIDRQSNRPASNKAVKPLPPKKPVKAKGNGYTRLTELRP
jgi:excisionase family DNA binding protein